MEIVCRVVIKYWALMVIMICLLLVTQTDVVHGKSLANNEVGNSHSNKIGLYSESEADVRDKKLVKRSAYNEKSFATDLEREERFWGWVKAGTMIYNGVKNVIDKRHG